MSTRILLVDNEAVQRTDLKESLARQGYLVVGETGDGSAAIDLARQMRPDLVLMDVYLPGADGLAIAEVLLREKIAPVVLLTASADHPLVERATVAGVVNYLIKPLRECEVVPGIEVALARYQAVRALEEQVESLSEQLETRKVVERAKGLLMQTQRLSEQEAFRRIRKTSMDNRKSMKSVAEAILITSEVSAP
jgi:two-component system, response regulator PdtaR